MEALNTQVPLLRSNPNDPAAPGVAELQKQYDDLAPDLKKIWTEDVVKVLNDSKTDRLKQEEDIKGGVDRLNKQRKEKVDKETAADAEQKQEEANKETEIKKISQERSKMTQDLDAVRLEHEGLQQKVTEVSRDLSKVRDVVSQGRIISADSVSKTAVIDIGTRNGVRKGMTFDIYDAGHRQLVKKGLLEVMDAGPFSSKCALLSPNRESRWDPISGYVPVDPNENYSKFVAGGPEETDAVELIKRRSVKDRVETLRLEKIAKEQGLEAAERARGEGGGVETPPVGLTLSLSPIKEGDWIFNPDFVATVSPAEFQKQMSDELKTMRDVNVGTLHFYIADTVRTYRKEYLKRLCERNGCKVSETMSPNVNFVVVGTGFTRADLLEDKIGIVQK